MFVKEFSKIWPSDLVFDPTWPIFELSLDIVKTNILTKFHNKRAQRALGRLPEEKVKVHSGANNREPQGHNLNNFGRGPSDDVIY